MVLDPQVNAFEKSAVSKPKEGIYSKSEHFDTIKGEKTDGAHWFLAPVPVNMPRDALPR